MAKAVCVSVRDQENVHPTCLRLGKNPCLGGALLTPRPCAPPPPHSDPAKINWGSAGVDIVIESTGVFTDIAKVGMGCIALHGGCAFNPALW